jgi:hypothetical protein
MAANYHDDTIRHQAKRLGRLRSKSKAYTPFPENLSSGLAFAGLVGRPVEENAPDLVDSLRFGDYPNSTGRNNYEKEDLPDY